ncbi:SH3 domain-containing protein [Miniphocaeibacter massiliensis]|uniref:SH3 domain-containing protein n=1 Tax=Miniphocaeibacter massiliensis TaxID=2041841 RepID=UPI000C1C0B54|nr:SH3 domain-containing protein [Miniphocaeibacter massiliensis]
MKDNMKDNQNTDKIDMSEINLRYREEEAKKKEPSQEKEVKKKTNVTPIMVFVVTILIALVIGLAYITIANNKDLNNKLKQLMKTTEETKPEETEPPTEETTESTKELQESEKKTGKLIQDLNFRSGPGYDYDVIGTIPAGTEVTGYKDRGWLKIEYNGQTGYIGPQYLE